MIRIVSVKNQYRTVIRIPLYAGYDDILETFSKKYEGEPIIEDVPSCINEIQLSVDDVCRIAKALKHEMAIDSALEPTPERQRIHQMLTS